MRSAITSLILLLLLAAATVAQNEQSPITERDFAYRNWTLPNLDGSGRTDLRTFAKGKKLVMVVYWAPWCHNWEHDRDFVQSLYDKYREMGFAVIGVGEYDPVSRMRDHVKKFNLTFPMVYESETSADRDKTPHYAMRREAGDTRRWGSPWYVFIEPDKMMNTGDILTRPTTVVNGELIRDEAERFIRAKLNLPQTSAGKPSQETAIEPCRDDKPAGNSAKKP